MSLWDGFKEGGG